MERRERLVKKLVIMKWTV